MVSWLLQVLPWGPCGSCWVERAQAPRVATIRHCDASSDEKAEAPAQVHVVQPAFQSLPTRAPAEVHQR